MCTISYKAFIKETNELVEDYENLSFILGDGDVMAGKRDRILIFDLFNQENF